MADPFYFAQKAQEYGYHPEIILAGRRLNDSMGKYVATEVVKLMIKKGTLVKGAKVLMLGIRFTAAEDDLLAAKTLVNDSRLTLGIINEVYIDARYPGDLGLLPHGKPMII